MLENMFMSPGKPSYQSSELMYLERIADNDYRDFIKKRFKHEGMEINDDSITKILEWSRLHTYYVQYVCSQLYGKGVSNISEELVNKIFHQIITDFEPQYLNYRNLLPQHQFRLLKAIAVEDGIIQPTPGSLIGKHNLTSASSVSTSLKALAEKEMIVFDRNKWNVYDIFLCRWFEYHDKV